MIFSTVILGMRVWRISIYSNLHKDIFTCQYAIPEDTWKRFSYEARVRFTANLQREMNREIDRNR